MKRSLVPLTVAALALTCLPPPVSSQEAPDSVDSYAFDLDTQSAHYSFWSLATLRHDRLRARLVVGELRRDKRWAPGFMLRLRNGEQVALLRIWAPERKPPLVVVLERHGGGGRADSVVFSGRIARDDTFHVDLDWSVAGVLRAVVEGEAHEVPLPFSPTAFEVIGSTGQIKADSLVLVRRR